MVLICSSEKCACRGERKCWPRELQIPNASCDPVRSSPVSISLFLSNPPGRQGCMWPHYFTLALHGITDDWGECRRLESTAEGEFWCGEQTPPRTPKLCIFAYYVEHAFYLSNPIQRVNFDKNATRPLPSLHHPRVTCMPPRSGWSVFGRSLVFVVFGVPRPWSPKRPRHVLCCF